jgi:hypothetical protein
MNFNSILNLFILIQQQNNLYNNLYKIHYSGILEKMTIKFIVAILILLQKISNLFSDSKILIGISHSFKFDS